LDGAKLVTIEGERIPVLAKVSAIGAYSSHGDKPKLLNWIGKISNPKPKKIFVIHGEIENNEALSAAIKQDTGIEAIIPEYGRTYEI